MSKTFLITTPLYYASGSPHIGHFYTTTLAFAICNYKKLMGYDAKLLSGTDEHGEKISKLAKENNIPVEEFVKQKRQLFIDLFKKTNIKIDFFVTTSQNNHKNFVENFFKLAFEKKYIYLDYYVGFYSIHDEEYITKNQALRINNEYYHPESKHKLTIIEQESYFLNVKFFKNFILKLINDQFLIPTKVVNEIVNNFISNLQDLSITRTDLDFAIVLPFNKKHKIYVWIDALLGYVSYLKSIDKLDKYWNNGEVVQIIGKEITRFHIIYFPIILNILNYKIPNKLIAHGWLLNNKEKISKSKNNAFSLEELFEKYNPELVQYYLVSKINHFEDGIFNQEVLKDVINSDLANNFGNLVSRVITLASKFEDGLYNYEQDKKFEEVIKNYIFSYQNFFNQFKVDKALSESITLSQYLNKYIEEKKPWKLELKDLLLNKMMHNLLNGIYAITTMLSVCMPNYMNKILQILQINELSIEKSLIFNKFEKIKLKKISPIFKKFNN